MYGRILKRKQRGDNMLKAPSIAGGQFMFKDLSSQVSAEEYAVAKVHMWLHMLNDGNKPTKWFKAYKNGTKVNFETIHSQEEYNQGIEELSIFTEEVNKEFHLGLLVFKGE